MRCLTVLVCLAATAARAQEPTPPPPPPPTPPPAIDPVRAESTPVPPAPPSPREKRFVDRPGPAAPGIALLVGRLNRGPLTMAEDERVSPRAAGPVPDGPGG